MDSAFVMIALGATFLIGLVADGVGRRLRLPRITLLLICGALAGNAGLNLFPPQLLDWYEFLATVSLTMVAFLLGSTLDASHLRAQGRDILVISVATTLTTFGCVAVGLWAGGLAPGLALILAAIASATAPTSIRDVVRQSGRVDGFSRTLLGIVVIDDVWGLILFSLSMVAAAQIAGSGIDGVALSLLWDLGGALLLGLVIGLPGAYLTGRLSENEPLMIEALALVFLTAGIARWLGLSFLLSGLCVGAVIVNRAKHHARAFHEIEHVQWPFVILFFILAGASFKPAAVVEIGIAGIAFVTLRVLARVLGGYAGAAVVRRPRGQRWWYGVSLLPQAGVAVGMGLVAAQEFPTWENVIMPLTVGTTILFELAGPLATAWAMRRAAFEDIRDLPENAD